MFFVGKYKKKPNPLLNLKLMAFYQINPNPYPYPTFMGRNNRKKNIRPIIPIIHFLLFLENYADYTDFLLFHIRDMNGGWSLNLRLHIKTPCFFMDGHLSKDATG